VGDGEKFPRGRWYRVRVTCAPRKGVCGRPSFQTPPVALQMDLFSSRLRPRSPRTASAIFRMWSGVLPQHAPTMRAPVATMAGNAAAMPRGSNHRPSCRPTTLGMPAFGYAAKNPGVALRISAKIAGTRPGPPSPQLHPTISAPASISFVAASAGLVPHMVRSTPLAWLYWKVILHMTGRSVASLPP